MKKTVLDGGRYTLFTKFEEIIEDGEAKEDVRSDQMYAELANDLLAELNSICKAVPFTAEICEFHCGEDEPRAYAKIVRLDARGHEVVYPTKKKPVSCLKTTQYYAARNNKHPEESYMGRIVIRVYMHMKPLSDNANSHLVENSLARPLLRLINSQYYEKIVKYFDEWDTDYRNAPKIDPIEILT